MNGTPEIALGYRFVNKKLLDKALTHCSYDSVDNNERLEFLGDAVVNLVIAQALFEQFPKAAEGDLSRKRAGIVNRDALGHLARQLQVGRFIRLGVGEIRSGGHDRQSILSCTMEALIGAMVLDSGFDVTRAHILRWHESILSTLSSDKSQKDPKTQLQEYCQARSQPLPLYHMEWVKGEGHDQSFQVKCIVEALKKESIGEGSSRKRAEQAAAQEMLKDIRR